MFNIIYKSISYLKDIDTKNSVFIIDKKVYSLYKKYFNKNFKIILIKSSEANKTLEAAYKIYKKLEAYNANKNTNIYAIGGGITLDLAGFIASSYLRGLNLILIPTSLLAQLDASIGSKNALNLKYKNKLLKNQIGFFYNPNKIIIIYDFLKTLNKAELINGFAELIKHSIIASNLLFNKIAKIDFNTFNLNNKKDFLLIKSLIKISISIKTKIVKLDYYDKNTRKKLNLGHSFAHAFESIYKIKHGKAVLLGILISAKLSLSFKYLSYNSYKKITKLILSLLNSKELKILNNFNKEAIFKILKKDKKANLNSIDYVFVSKISKVFIKNIEIKNLNKL